jgi:hypothetical protein
MKAPFRSFFRCRRGSVAIEAAMAIPAMLIVFGAISQVMITAQARVHLEQAAYAAARSALVYKCPDFNLVDLVRSSVSVRRPTECMLNRAALDAEAQRRAEDAARWALIAAAPTSGSASARGCDQVDAAVELLTGRDQIMGRNQVVENAICYVFEPGNVTVTLDWDRSFLAQLSGRTDIPVTATVTFNFPLSTPFRRFIHDGKRGDGTYYKTGSATVTLL